MMKRLLSVLVAAGCLAAVPAVAQEEPPPQAVVVLNNTRFELLAEAIVIPAGQSERFEVRSGGFARASLLIGGSTRPGAGVLRVATAYGPPFVPAGPPRKLQIDSQGNVRGQVLEPVLGPAMVVMIQNDSAADATISMSAYFAN